MQFDSDREIASENEAETNSDCATASEQSDKIDSDTTEQLTDSDVDPEYTIFPISLAKADEVCVRLNDLIQVVEYRNTKYFISIWIQWHMLWLIQITNLMKKWYNFLIPLTFSEPKELLTLSGVQCGMDVVKEGNLDQNVPNQILVGYQEQRGISVLLDIQPSLA